MVRATSTAFTPPTSCDARASVRSAVFESPGKSINERGQIKRHISYVSQEKGERENGKTRVSVRVCLKQKSALYQYEQLCSGFRFQSHCARV